MEDILRNVPGVGPVNFPDSMKGEDIDAAVERLSKDAMPPMTTPPTTTPARPPAVALPVGVPARGRGTQWDPSNPGMVPGVKQFSTEMGTPMLDTGHPALDALATPANAIAALAAVGGGAAVLRAGLSGGFAGAGWEAFTQAAPQIRYEIIKSVLERGHIPGAQPIALALSMWMGKGGGSAAAEPAAPGGAKVTAPPTVIPGSTGTSLTPGAAPPTAWPEPMPPAAPPAAPPTTSTPMTPAPVRAASWPPQAAAGPSPPPVVQAPYRPTPDEVVRSATSMQPGASVPAASWTPGTIGDFVKQSSGPAVAAAEGAATPAAAASTPERAIKMLADAGMTTTQATRTVAKWARQGVTDLVRAATHYADQFLKD